MNTTMSISMQKFSLITITVTSGVLGTTMFFMGITHQFDFWGWFCIAGFFGVMMGTIFGFIIDLVGD